MSEDTAAETGPTGFLANLRKTQERQAGTKEGIYELTKTPEIDPSCIVRWEGKDRPENELGDINELAQSFIDIGQQVSCIVRPYKTKKGIYELIVGERRWHAARQAGVNLKVTIREFDDRMAALIQAVENENRKDISDFAKGMSYSKKIENGTLKQKDLTEILKISKQHASRLLCYNKIPTLIFEAIGDFRKVSARTAHELCTLSTKGQEYSEAIIKLAEDIRNGAMGHQKLRKKVESIIKKDCHLTGQIEKAIGENGRHLYTLKVCNNSKSSIHFPSDINKILNSRTSNVERFKDRIKEAIQEELLNS